MNLRISSRQCVFHWNPQLDQAGLDDVAGATLWRGSLLPALHLPDGGTGERILIARVADQPSAGADDVSASLSDGSFHLPLVFIEPDSPTAPPPAQGSLDVEFDSQGLRFKRLSLKWTHKNLPLRGMSFGYSPVDPARRAMLPAGHDRYWPDWRASGYCIPGGEGNPLQSYWRFFDGGSAIYPLGSFGPSMGTPYAAAFPRPLLALAMGGLYHGGGGWCAMGPGALPEGSANVHIQAGSASLRYWMREDLWGAPAGPSRQWESPLSLSWGADAWEALHELFAMFHLPKLNDDEVAARTAIQCGQWCTWGSFKHGVYDLKSQLDKAREVRAGVIVIDDGWETFGGSGQIRRQRFPRFEQEVDAMRQADVRPALWQSVGWIDHPERVGLTHDDLLCRADGTPALSHWNMDPRTEQAVHYCLDPSSPRAREFLVQRTRQAVRELRPCMLKLDFGYGLPSPDVAAPRDPIYRGERLCMELLKIIRDAGRSVDPTLCIEYYGVHPLFRDVTDILSLDDLGDAGPDETRGHDERSIWAALAGQHGMAVVASSGYRWNHLEAILLNAAVLGTPGAVLPDYSGHDLTTRRRIISRLVALNLWHRRTLYWRPLWLNSCKGDLMTSPRPFCWGRLEQADVLTSLALRQTDQPAPDLSKWGIVSWTGDWAIISQGDHGIDDLSRPVALIPFTTGHITFKNPPTTLRKIIRRDQAQEDRTTREVSVDQPDELIDLVGFITGPA